MARSRRWLLLAACTVLVLAGTNASVRAQASAWKGLPVAGVRLEGWPTDVDDGIVADLALHGRRRLLRRDRVEYYPALLDDDRRRLQLYLARHGYPDARVEGRVIPDAKGRAVRVVLRVHAGQPVRIAQHAFHGWPPDAGTPPEPPAALATGNPVRDAAVHGYTNTLREVLLDHGHALATVDVALRPRPPRRVDLVWTAHPGPRYRIGRIEVRGVQDDLAALARETLGFEVGETYSRRNLRRAEDNLRLLRLFRRIRLDVTPADSTTLVLQCDLQARAPRTWSVGGGYWTDEGPGGFTEWVHRNAARRGRGVQARVEGSPRLQRARGTLNLPSLLGPRTWGLLSAEFRRENEDAYVLREERLALELTKPFSIHTRLRGGLTISQLDFDTNVGGLDVEDPAGIVSRFRVAWNRQHVDDLLDPHRGTTVGLEFESAPPGLGSAAEYASVRGNTVGYTPLAPRTTGVVRVALGLAWPLGRSDAVLLSERLFAGGSRSMRGFRRRALGPVDAHGDPVGGQAKLEGSIELRTPLWRRLFVAGFLDAGQVWADVASFDVLGLATAAGAGAYARTPVGVLRVDVAWPLQDPGRDEPVRVFHLSIGQPF